MSNLEDLEDVFEACVLSGLYEPSPKAGKRKQTNQPKENSLDFIVTEEDVKEIARLASISDSLRIHLIYIG